MAKGQTVSKPLPDSSHYSINSTRQEGAFQALFNSSLIGIYIVQNGKFQFVNPRFQEYTGYSEHELLGSDSLSFVHPENNISPETPLLLTGELSIAAATGQLIQTEVEYPVEPLVPSLKFPSDCPVTLYAVNMGLALKKVPRETATGYRDINVNILSEKYRKPAVHRVPVRYTLLITILIIAIGLLIPLYQVKNQASAETARLRSELSAYSQELHEARLASDEATQSENTVNELSAEVKTIRQEHRDILAQGGNFANILRMVTSALPPPAYFTSIEIGSEQITIRGKADSAFTVVTYSTALEKLEEFATVHIAEIDENAGAEDAPDGALRTSISFMIVVSQS